MKVTTSTIKQLLIENAPSLDPIRVMLENYNLGQGRITVTCYGRAWTAAWFAMGNETIEQFIASSGTDYILGNMVSHMTPGLKANKKHEEVYLTRIIDAVKVAIVMQNTETKDAE